MHEKPFVPPGADDSTTLPCGLITSLEFIAAPNSILHAVTTDPSFAIIFASVHAMLIADWIASNMTLKIITETLNFKFMLNLF